MKHHIYIFTFILLIKSIYGYLFCQEKVDPPIEFEEDPSFNIKPEMSGKTYDTIIVNNMLFMKEGIQIDPMKSDFCPIDFDVPTKEDFENLISNLGNNAYSILSDPNGLNMSAPKYYFTQNQTGTGFANYYLLHFDGEEVKIDDLDITKVGFNNIFVLCLLRPPKTAKIIFPDSEDFDYNISTYITTDNKYFNKHLWKISNDDNYYKTSSINASFTQSGGQKIEYWGQLVTGTNIYLCEYIFVKKRNVLSEQEFSDSNIKKIETDFDMTYSNELHFVYSNSPVAPRIDGGYYIAFSDEFKFLHILSYDKDDNLLKNYNTTQKGNVFDITSTDYGFVVYILDPDRPKFHSFLSLYNKNFKLINTVQIMNNTDTDNRTLDSDQTRQIMKYVKNGSPAYGMRFMYDPDNAKLLYSKGRIFLIFAHYNHFDSGGHTGDTVVTFNDLLEDIDFGITWGASHSLIQSGTIDDNYFWTASLSDAYPSGIKVEYTSKKEFSSTDYDPINEKYNSRIASSNDSLAGYIYPYMDGRADGKLGGLLYYENLGLYVLVYAKTPVNTTTNTDNVIYATTWKFEDNKITSVEIKIIKNFGPDDNIMQLRAGKLGDNLLVIIYAPTTLKGSNWYGDIPKGTIPKVFVIELPSFNFLKNDIKVDNLLMNTNEDLRTFDDGVLIWATSNENGKLTINKIGVPRLDDTFDNNKYILTKKDLNDEYEEETKEEEKPNDENEEKKESEKNKEHEEESKEKEEENKEHKQENKENEEESKEKEEQNKEYEEENKENEEQNKESEKNKEHEEQNKEHEEQNKENEEENKEHEDENKEKEEQNKEKEEQNKEKEEQNKEHEQESKENEEQNKEHEDENKEKEEQNKEHKEESKEHEEQSKENEHQNNEKEGYKENEQENKESEKNKEHEEQNKEHEEQNKENEQENKEHEEKNKEHEEESKEKEQQNKEKEEIKENEKNKEKEEENKESNENKEEEENIEKKENEEKKKENEIGKEIEENKEEEEKEPSKEMEENGEIKDNEENKENKEREEENELTEEREEKEEKNEEKEKREENKESEDNKENEEIKESEEKEKNDEIKGDEENKENEEEFEENKEREKKEENEKNENEEKEENKENIESEEIKENKIIENEEEELKNNTKTVEEEIGSKEEKEQNKEEEIKHNEIDEEEYEKKEIEIEDKEKDNEIKENEEKYNFVEQEEKKNYEEENKKENEIKEEEVKDYKKEEEEEKDDSNGNNKMQQNIVAVAAGMVVVVSIISIIFFFLRFFFL